MFYAWAENIQTSHISAITDCGVFSEVADIRIWMITCRAESDCLPHSGAVLRQDEGRYRVEGCISAGYTPQLIKEELF